MNKTRQDLLECRRRGKAGGRGRGRGTCCCCCLCTLTGPVQPYEFVGQLPQTDNHYNQVNKMMIIVSSSASTAAAAQHVALFIFSDLFEDFLWVVRSTLFPPRVSAFSTRCTYAYVCFFIIYLYGHYEFRAQQSRRITIKRRGKWYLFIRSLNLNCAPCQLSLEMLRVVFVVAIIVMLFVVVFGLNAAEHI